ncbi:MAG: tetratricopeptide repeat protein [Caldimonas sp.]
MRLRLLGAPALAHEGGTLVFAAERRFQLLALLAHRGEWVSRERLSALFWPDHPADAARRNLRKVLYRLHELGTEVFGATPLEEQGGAMRWAVATDLAEFEQAVEQGDRAAALAVWQGEPWQGIDAGASAALADWLQLERQRLAARWRDTLLSSAADAAKPLESLRLAELALAHNPLDEEALFLALKALLALDRRAEAARAYQEFTHRLAESFGLEPSARLVELLRGGATPDAAARGTRAAPRDDASTPREGPAGQQTNFIGRQMERREIAALLEQPGCRWITLVGPGGIGKSRLLAEVVAGLGGAATLIPLEDVRSAEGVALRIAAALGVSVAEADEASTYRQLAAAVGADLRVLALDNLEHLLPAIGDLRDWLRHCPGLRIIATSRERTGAADEWLMPVAGLPYPELEDADRAEAFDAVRLFVARARQVDPRFHLEPERADVVELCRWVEGMPLAIELAAVWVRHFRAAEIVSELRSGGEMLHQRGDDRLPPRQRSMAATFDHSWRLLVPEERRVLAALSVFRGGFTRAAATAAAGASLAVLMALIEKSLVRREETGAVGRGDIRYGLHPLVQELAAAKIACDPLALRAAESAHADYFVRYLQAIPGTEHAARRAAFRSAARVEIDNLFVAWQRAADAGRIALLAQMATPFRVVVFGSLRRAEMLMLLDAAREPMQRELPRSLPLLDLSRGILQYGLGRFVESADILRHAVKGLARGSDRRDHRTSLVWLGQALIMLGVIEGARQCFEQALESAQADNDDTSVSDCIGNLGAIDFQLGRFETAVSWLQQSLVMRQAVGGELALVYNNLGLAQIHAGRARTAIDTLQRGLKASEGEPDPEARAFLHYNLGQAHFELGEVDRAEVCAQASTREIEGGHAPALAISAGGLLARIALKRGDSATALRLLRSATRGARERRIAPLELGLLFHWVEWLLHTQDVSRARVLHSWTLAQDALESTDRLFGESQRAAFGPASGKPPSSIPSKDEVEAILIDLLVSP